VREELGLAPDAPTLLFAGRIVPEKNPVFAVDVLAHMRQRRPDVVGVFVGAGSLESAIRARAAELGQTSAVTLTGWRADVPQIMAASDWFILPHPEDPPEGFGIAVVEAQLAGLRLLVSRGVLDDPLLPTAVYRRLALADGAAAWASAALEMLDEPGPSREAALAAHRDSPMDMDHALADLLGLYG
jgi:glycosyltransferase involved in cell wall biosynthesis